MFPNLPLRQKTKTNKPYFGKLLGLASSANAFNKMNKNREKPLSKLYPKNQPTVVRGGRNQVPGPRVNQRIWKALTNFTNYMFGLKEFQKSRAQTRAMTARNKYAVSKAASISTNIKNAKMRQAAAALKAMSEGRY